MPRPPAPPGQTMRYWLGLTMKEHRQRAGFKASKVAGLCDMAESSISRFESAEQWPVHVDQILAAYAHALDVPDPRVFYDQALKRWRDEGEAPRVEPAVTPSEVVAAEAAQASQRRRNSPPAPAASPARHRRSTPAA